MTWLVVVTLNLLTKERIPHPPGLQRNILSCLPYKNRPNCSFGQSWNLFSYNGFIQFFRPNDGLLHCTDFIFYLVSRVSVNSCQKQILENFCPVTSESVIPKQFVPSICSPSYIKAERLLKGLTLQRLCLYPKNIWT